MTEDERLELKAKLHASPLYFTEYFFKARTGKDFVISQPISRRPHQILIFEELYKVFTGETKRLIINIPPRYGKTISVIHFISWALSIYPDSNFIYVSYAKSLAKLQTQTVRDIISLREYQYIFGVGIDQAQFAKDDFMTSKGGGIFAAGADGPITGRGAGIFGVDRFGGAIIIDDILKPTEAASDTVRQDRNEWFDNTLQSRLNSPNTPIVVISQRVHEEDLPAKLIQRDECKTLVLKALDDAGNALDPEKHSKESLLKMKENAPYVFAAQYQQDPQPAGGGLFKETDFYVVENEPEILCSFITADTAESTKTYADYTVFSFWGLIKLSTQFYDSDELGLHWIDCMQARIEPKDMLSAFMDFYAGCMRHISKPSVAAIEKKSTGATLVSILDDLRGIQVVGIERSATSGSKIDRFISMQPYIAKKLISLPRYGKHTHMCIEHMRKITNNDSHRHDDICDTVYDAIKLALIDKTMHFYIKNSLNTNDNKLDKLVSFNKRLDKARGAAYR